MTKRRKLGVLFAILAFVAPARAQDQDEGSLTQSLPEAEIFLFAYDPEAASDALSGGTNTTRRAGYDNQPFFTGEGETFLYSRGDGIQTDIWEYDIATRRHSRITFTEKSEYSPTPSPDGRTISMVYERNNSIWHLDRDAVDDPAWSLESAGVEEPVGYFALNHETGDILFWSRYGYNVTLTHAKKPVHHFITGHAVPATPHVIPGSRHFSFVHRQDNEEVWIKAFDPETRAVWPLVPIVGSNANHAWTPDGSILQIEGAVLYRWRKGDADWQKISDLSEHGMASASRVAVSPDGTRIAIVGLPKS